MSRSARLKAGVVPCHSPARKGADPVLCCMLLRALCLEDAAIAAAHCRVLCTQPPAPLDPALAKGASEMCAVDNPNV